MIKPNKEILEKYDSFQNFMSAKKFTSTPIVVKDKRLQHPSSLEYESSLSCSVPFGNSYVSIEVKNGDHRNFSAKMMTTEITSKILLRYDSAGLCHRNNLDDIPLLEQKVTTPHIHKYDEKGRLIAIKTERILANQDKAADIKYGFPIFCYEANILGENSTTCPALQVGALPILPFKQEIEDPCEGVPF